MKYIKYKTYTDLLLDDNFDYLLKNYEKVGITNYFCLLCKKHFKRKDHLKRHILCTHEKLEIYRCNFYNLGIF